MQMNKPSNGHNINGANKSFLKPQQAHYQKIKRGEIERSRAFYEQRARDFEMTRAAQAAARGGT